MPAIHFRTTVDAPPAEVFAALATQDGLAGNWTDQLEVPEQEGGVARFGFGPGWDKTARAAHRRARAVGPHVLDRGGDGQLVGDQPHGRSAASLSAARAGPQ
jgi:uncharacterized protein YndB with AHSA1/START domain